MHRGPALLLLLLAALLASCSAVSGVILRSAQQPYAGDGVFLHSMALFALDPSDASYNRSGSVVWLDNNLSLCAALNDADRAAVNGKIILAQRTLPDPDAKTPCSFHSRAQLAQSAGAIGLIIGDNHEEDVTFVSRYMGPFTQPPDISIPVIFVLTSTYQLIHQPVHNDTVATLNGEGLIFSLAEYEEELTASTRYESLVQVVFVAFPLLLAAFSYHTWYQTSQDRQQEQPQQQPPAPPADAQQPQQQQPPQQGDAQQQVQFSQHGVPQQHAEVGGSSGALMHSVDIDERLSLPVPPHLSSLDEPAQGNSSARRSSFGADSVELGNVSVSASASSRRRMSAGDESEGALLGAGADSRSASDDAALADQPLSPIGAAAPHQQLARHLLPAPSVPASQRLYYNVLKFVSSLGKPWWILRINGAVFAFHLLCATVVLFLGWNEHCQEASQSMVSLWMARALIGFRICYWQTHSNNGSRPMCLDIFFKNWTDCIFLFTGTLSPLTDDDRAQCQVTAPITYWWVQLWTISIYITYGLRVLVFLADRASTRFSDKVPHLFSIGARSLLSISQGGFSCAGPLDANQPATQLDLMLIPVVSFQDGMYPPDDAVCGVCLGDYAAGEQLRVLNCSHHFHRECVDTWLKEKNTCPSCRSSIDSNLNHRAAGAQRVQQPVAAAVPRQEVAVAADIERPPSPSRVGTSRFDEDRAAQSGHFSQLSAGEV